MRTAFLSELFKLAEQDERIWLICGDLGYSVLESFAQHYPDRFLNAGVAEQNMIGIAAGLALSGKIPFVYSIANFPVMRCLEQIRNDVCYHNLPVKIVAVGCGYAYGSHGYTHHGVEDLAVMRAMPNMAVLAPGDPVEARLVTRASLDWDGPAYLRLGKAGEPIVHRTEPDYEIGKAIVVCEGSDLTIASTGGMLQPAVDAAVNLRSQGLSTGVLSIPTVSPLDYTAILTAVNSTGRLLTVEEHGPGGLGSAVAEILAERGLAVRFKALRLPPKPVSRAGSQATLRSAQGLSPEGIAAAALKLCS